VGGLIFSTNVTLLVLPSIYAILDDWRQGMRRVLREARGLPPIEAEPETA
jgi:HAE1 family hydrophobic/amphiphilic exporter-1